jgi:uncharacterized protein YbjT (DUF2867 family)
MRREAVILGSTGLTGAALIAELALERRPIEVIALLRAPSTALPDHVKQVVVDMSEAANFTPHIPADAWVFCCVGTTMAKAGSHDAFRQVDFALPLKLAKAAKEANASGFSVLSSVGARARGFFFYTRTKGELEHALQQIGFASLHIFRPSLLVGKRSRPRVGEFIAKAIFTLFTPLLIGPLAKYRPVKVRQLARAMLRYARSSQPGIRIYQGTDLFRGK